MLQCRCSVAVSGAGHPVPFQQHVAPPCERHYHHSLSRRPALLAEPPFPALQAAALAAHHSSVSHPSTQTRLPQQPVSLLPFACLPMCCTSCLHCALRPSHNQASPPNPPPRAPPTMSCLVLQCAWGLYIWCCNAHGDSISGAAMRVGIVYLVLQCTRGLYIWCCNAHGELYIWCCNAHGDCVSGAAMRTGIAYLVLQCAWGSYI